jgi:hypothetical protein
MYLILLIDNMLAPVRLGGKAGAVNGSSLASDGLILQTKVEEVSM